MKLYLVWQSSGEYDTYHNSLIGAFTTKEKAEEVKRIYDGRIIPDNEVYAIVPEDIYFEWEYNDDTGDYADTYKGYTKEQRDDQDERIYMSYGMYDECVIEEIDTDSYYDITTDKMAGF